MAEPQQMAFLNANEHKSAFHVYNVHVMIVHELGITGIVRF
jgi:hypothetical protein